MVAFGRMLPLVSMVSETPKSINVFASTPSNLSTLVISTSLTSMVDPLSVIFADDSILPLESAIKTLLSVNAEAPACCGYL